MRKIPLIPAIAAALLFISSCCKDHLLPPNEISPYQIKTFSLVRGFDAYNDTLHFSYDKYGNPTTITRPYPGTGYPNFAFHYDKAHRLTEYIGTYPNPDVEEFIHRYFYNNAGLITLDSVYTIVELTNGQVTWYSGSYAHYIKYDREDRIISDSTTEPGISGTTTYAYDSRGNLIDGAAYDNKVNFHRTNLVWMFLDHNYSQNNPFTATTYNGAGLPLIFTPDAHGGDQYFLYDNFFIQASIVYERR